VLEVDQVVVGDRRELARRLQDSRIDIEPYINVALATRIARITNRHFTTGTGALSVVSWNIQRPEVR
jgi:hypothetical protein